MRTDPSTSIRATLIRMRALMNFMHNRGWSFHIVAEDCKTVLVGYRHVASREVLLRIVAKLGGSVADAETDIRRWNRGSVWIEPSPAQYRFLGTRWIGTNQK